MMILRIDETRLFGEWYYVSDERVEGYEQMYYVYNIRSAVLTDAWFCPWLLWP